MDNLQLANDQLGEKSKQFHAIMEEMGSDLDLDKVTSLHGDKTDKLEQIKNLSAELDRHGAERDNLQSLKDMRDQSEKNMSEMFAPVAEMRHSSGPARRQSVGEMFVNSKEFQTFKGLRNWPTPAVLDWSFKNAVFREGAGWAPEEIRLDGYQESAQRPINVVDFIPQYSTALDNIRYMLETTFTNNAVETAEATATTAADAIGEGALALTEQSNPVEWLPTFIPVTIQQLEDVDGAFDYVENRLVYMVRARLDSQVLVGNGTTPNILGTNSVTGINTQAKGADPTPDAVYKAFRAIRGTGFAEPSVLFAHPNDWQDVRLLRTADGQYLWGAPADTGPDRIWGVRVVQTAAATEHTMTCGDYASYSGLYTKRGITIDVSDSHSFYFPRGLVAIRASLRAAMVHFRASAFATVTGV